MTQTTTKETLESTQDAPVEVTTPKTLPSRKEVVDTIVEDALVRPADYISESVVPFGGE